MIKLNLLFCLLFMALVCYAGNLPLHIKSQVQDRYGDSGVTRLEQWEALVWEINYLPEHEQLRKVNDFFNRLDFRSDQEHWQQEDYWATPIETLATHGGDCEDFAIAKYFTLRQVGVAAERLRITYVKALELNEPHMVLTYYPRQGEALVLDILMPELLPTSRRPDLLPVYSFNGDGLWREDAPGRDTRLGNSEDIALWRDLQLRLGLGEL